MGSISSNLTSSILPDPGPTPYLDSYYLTDYILIEKLSYLGTLGANPPPKRLRVFSMDYKLLILDTTTNAILYSVDHPHPGWKGFGKHLELQLKVSVTALPLYSKVTEKSQSR